MTSSSPFNGLFFWTKPLSAVCPPLVDSALSVRYDRYGQQILFESRDKYTGKPTVWYQFDAKGNKLRHERGAFGITVVHMNTGPFL